MKKGFRLRKCKECDSHYDATLAHNKNKVYRCSANGYPCYRTGKNSDCHVWPKKLIKIDDNKD